MDHDIPPSDEQFDDPDTLNKYSVAGRVAAEAVNHVVSNCVPGAKVYDLCQMGNRFITERFTKVFKKQLKYGKGISFPTCVSVNQIAGYHSPPSTYEYRLKDGDLVKVELGTHVDGYPASICYTCLVGPPISETDPRALVTRAVYAASKQVTKHLKPGGSNVELVNTMNEIAKEHGCNLLLADATNIHAPGVISYQMSRNVFDGQNEDDDEDVHKLILSRKNDTYDFDLRELEFEEDEVYGIDIAMSTGFGKVGPSDHPTTILKRDHNITYNLRMKSSRALLSSVSKSHFPMAIDEIATHPRTRLGLRECIGHRLIEPYPVLQERSGHFVARVKFTVVIRKKTKKNKRGHTIIAALPSAPALEKFVPASSPIPTPAEEVVENVE